MKFGFLAVSVASATFAVALLAGSAPAEAKKSSSKGALFISTKAFPSKASSESAMRSAAKKVSQKRIPPVDEDATKEWEYVFQIMAFFSKPLLDTAVTIVIFDITDDTMRKVTSFEQYLNNRGQKSYKSSVQLRHPDQDIKPNRRYLVQLLSRGAQLAEAEFETTGKVPKKSGNVIFTEDDAKK